MDQKPTHYDGSIPFIANSNDQSTSEPFRFTEEMRQNIGSNPYEFDLNK